MKSETDPFKVTETTSMLPNSTLFLLDLLAAFDLTYHSLHVETLSSLGFHDNVLFRVHLSILAAFSQSLLLAPSTPPPNAVLSRTLF